MVFCSITSVWHCWQQRTRDQIVFYSITSVWPCWQQRTHDQKVFYSITYFSVALLTTDLEDMWPNGILLYDLLLCGLVDNRGHMIKWYFTLLLTSLWPCWQQRTCDQIVFYSITYSFVALKSCWQQRTHDQMVFYSITSVWFCWQQRTRDQIVFYSITYFFVALLTTEDMWRNGILLYILLRCVLVDNREHVTKWYFTLLLTSLWPCWQQRTHDQMVFYSITYFCVALLTTEDTWPNGILLYYITFCGLADKRTQD